jgi:hypothetical protein
MHSMCNINIYQVPCRLLTLIKFICASTPVFNILFLIFVSGVHGYGATGREVAGSIPVSVFKIFR